MWMSVIEVLGKIVRKPFKLDTHVHCLEPRDNLYYFALFCKLNV